MLSGGEERVRSSAYLLAEPASSSGLPHPPEVAQRVHRDGITLRDAALTLKHVTADEFDRWVRPSEMVWGRIDR